MYGGQRRSYNKPNIFFVCIILKDLSYKRSFLQNKIWFLIKKRYNIINSNKKISLYLDNVLDVSVRQFSWLTTRYLKNIPKLGMFFSLYT